MTVHQIVAGFHVGDAISNETLLIANLLSEHGISNVFELDVAEITKQKGSKWDGLFE